MTRPWQLIDSHWLRMVKEFLPPTLAHPAWTGETRQHVGGVVSALQEGRPADAAAAAAAVVPLLAGQPDLIAFALAMKACGELQLEAFDAALASLAEASSHRPHDPRLVYSTGLVELRRGHVEAATERFEHAVTLDESLGQAWAAVAIIRALEQDHSRCEVAARRALACGVKLDGALVDLALLQSTYRLGKPIEGCCQFSALEQDSDAVLARLLPVFPPVPAEELTHPNDGRPILFLFADHTYVVRHAVALILSLAVTHPNCRIHLHVANPERNLRPLLRRLAAVIGDLPLVVTTESVHVQQFCAASIYFSCMRFVRFLQVLEQNESPVILLDVDLLARNNPLAMFDNHPEADVVLARAEFDPLWGEVFAGAVAIRPTAGGLAFARRVASLILDNLDKQTGRWFLDQIALAVCYDRSLGEARIVTIPKPEVASRRFAASALFSSVVNEQKQADNAHNRYKRELLEQSGLSGLLVERPYAVERVSTPTGPMLVDTGDAFVGQSIRTAGAWCRHELELLAALLSPGQTVVEGGANIGAHTITLAKQVGPSGRVYAFEPQRLVFQILAGNLAINELTNVFAIPKGLGCQRGSLHVGHPKGGNNHGAVRLLEHDGGTLEMADVMPLDELQLDACHLIKLDCEWMEQAALEGARQTIRRHRPVLYVENHEDEGDSPLIRLIDSLGYRMFWHGVETRNPNMLCLPLESRVQVNGLRPVACANGGRAG